MNRIHFTFSVSFFACFCSMSTISLAQLPNAYEYFPLSVGNKWIYHVLQKNPLFERYIESDTLLGDTLRIYKAIEDFADFGREVSYFYYNRDSTVVYQSQEFPQDINSGFPILDTRKGLGVKWVVTHDNITRAFAIVDTGKAELFNQKWSSAQVYEVDPFADSLILLEAFGRYVVGIGLIQSGEDYLVYAKINGIEYGTLPTSVDEISNEDIANIPKRFHLRVYPNPVKESATFFLNTPLTQEVEILIINILGRTVRKLTTKPASNSFQLVWDGKDKNGNTLSNGAYFAIVKSGEILESTKFLYLKR